MSGAVVSCKLCHVMWQPYTQRAVADWRLAHVVLSLVGAFRFSPPSTDAFRAASCYKKWQGGHRCTVVHTAAALPALCKVCKPVNRLKRTSLHASPCRSPVLWPALPVPTACG